ncbi:MAG TPA: DUF192 domain-containing protein [Rhizomicrobium sp.]|nr:DUF192 domain-containing protein [Rhizomicrobium sp.]
MRLNGKFSSFWHAASIISLLLGIVATLAHAEQALPRTLVMIDTPRGPARFVVEVAADEDSRMRGLMFRTKLAPDAGMLFDFPDVRFRSFWMKNTILPLDILFLRADGTISSIAANAKPYSEKDISSQEPVRAVLEINGGRAAALGILPGGRVHAAIFKNALPGQ